MSILSNKTGVVLGVIVLMAFGLRMVMLDKVPPALNWDEVSHGYNAYSILKTGRDEWGVKYPVVFRAYGDYKLPVYIYLTVITELLGGLTSLAVRFPSVLAGTLSVMMTYFLARELTGKREAALWASFLMAVEPMPFFLSRGAFEANAALCLAIAGTYFLIRGVKGGDWRMAWGAVLFGLTVWTYNAYRVFAPVWLVIFGFIYRQQMARILRTRRTIAVVTVIVAGIFLAPMFYQLVKPYGQARYGWVAIIDSGAVGRIIELREKSDFGPVLTRLIYNRPSYFVYRFGLNYLSHFSPSFLFLKGGSHYQFSVSGTGLFYLVNLPLILMGMKILGKKREGLLVLGWLLIAPIPSSLTREAPHVLRFITVLPIPMMLTAVGVCELKIKMMGRKGWYLVYGLTILWVGGIYWNKYFGSYRRDYSEAWQYGYKEAVEFVRENYENYDWVVVTKKYGEPHEFFLFYWPWVPQLYQKDENLIRFGQSGWYWVDRFDKFYFVNDWEIVGQMGNEIFPLESGGVADCRGLKCLLVTAPGNVPDGWGLIKEINFLNGKGAFEIYEN